MSRMNRMSMVAGASLTTAWLGLTVFGSGNAIVRAEAQNTGTAQTVWDGAYSADQSQRGEKWQPPPARLATATRWLVPISDQR